MTTTALDAALGKLEEQHLTVLTRALANAQRALAEAAAPTQAQLEAYERARIAVERARAGGAETETRPAGRCKTSREAERYLKEQGYRVDHSSIARAAKAGKLVRDKDGCFPKASLDTYAVAHCPLLSGSDPRDDRLAQLAERKLKAETEAAEWKSQHSALKYRVDTGEYLLAAEVERRDAAKVLLLKADLTNWCHAAVPEILSRVKGDPDRAADLLEYLLGHKTRWVNRYAEHAGPFLAPNKREEDHED